LDVAWLALESTAHFGLPTSTPSLAFIKSVELVKARGGALCRHYDGKNHRQAADEGRPQAK